MRIRHWILENDWLEALIALPEQLFYNTGIATYVWVLTNRKAPARRGKVQLIDAAALAEAARQAGLRFPAPIKKAILSALSERDPTAAIRRGRF